MNASIMARIEQLEIHKTYDATAAWLRDCVRKGNVPSVKRAEAKLKELDYQLASVESVQGGE